MEEKRVKIANDMIMGYAKGFITDEECNEMIDLALNEISTITEDTIECSADLDWQMYYESI